MTAPGAASSTRRHVAISGVATRWTGISRPDSALTTGSAAAKATDSATNRTAPPARQDATRTAAVIAVPP